MGVLSSNENLFDRLGKRQARDANPGPQTNRTDAGDSLGRGATSEAMTFTDEDGNPRKWWKPTRDGWLDENAIVS